MIPEEKLITNDSLSEEAISRQAKIITDVWPTVTEEARSEFPEFTQMFENIKDKAAPTFIGAQIPVKSGLVIIGWENRFRDYHDQLLCKFLKFGWPLGYHRMNPPQTVTSNHPRHFNTCHMCVSLLKLNWSMKQYWVPSRTVRFRSGVGYHR